MQTLIVGTGSEIYRDDGIGVAIIKELQKLPLLEETTIAIIGTNAFSLLNYDLVKYERIIIIDALDMGGPGGDLYFIPGDRLKPCSRPFSIHDITWLEVLDMAGFLPKTYLFAVGTNTLKLGEGLSPILKTNIKFYAEKLYKCVVEKCNSGRV